MFMTNFLVDTFWVHSYVRIGINHGKANNFVFRLPAAEQEGTGII